MALAEKSAGPLARRQKRCEQGAGSREGQKSAWDYWAELAPDESGVNKLQYELVHERNQELAEEKREAVERAESLQAQLDDFRSAWQQLRETLANAASERDAERQHFQHSITSYENHLSELNSALSSEQEQRHSAEAELRSTQSALHSSRSDNSRLSKRVSELECLLEEANAVRERAESDAQHYSDSVQQWKAAHDKAQHALKAYENWKNSTDEHREQWEAKLCSQEFELLSRQEECQLRERRLDEEEERRRHELDQREVRLNKMIRDKDQALDALRLQKDEVVAAKDNRIDSLCKEVQELRQEQQNMPADAGGVDDTARLPASEPKSAIYSMVEHEKAKGGDEDREEMMAPAYREEVHNIDVEGIDVEQQCNAFDKRVENRGHDPSSEVQASDPQAPAKGPAALQSQEEDEEQQPATARGKKMNEDDLESDDVSQEGEAFHGGLEYVAAPLSEEARPSVPRADAQRTQQLHLPEQGKWIAPVQGEEVHQIDVEDGDAKRQYNAHDENVEHDGSGLSANAETSGPRAGAERADQELNFEQAADRTSVKGSESTQSEADVDSDDHAKRASSRQRSSSAQGTERRRRSPRLSSREEHHNREHWDERTPKRKREQLEPVPEESDEHFLNGENQRVAKDGQRDLSDGYAQKPSQARGSSRSGKRQAGKAALNKEDNHDDEPVAKRTRRSRSQSRSRDGSENSGQRKHDEIEDDAASGPPKCNFREQYAEDSAAPQRASRADAVEVPECSDDESIRIDEDHK